MFSKTHTQVGDIYVRDWPNVRKSKEHKGHRSSELRLDDTTQEISAALMNDHRASYCNWPTPWVTTPASIKHWPTTPSPGRP